MPIPQISATSTAAAVLEVVVGKKEEKEEERRLRWGTEVSLQEDGRS